MELSFPLFLMKLLAFQDIEFHVKIGKLGFEQPVEILDIAGIIEKSHYVILEIDKIGRIDDGLSFLGKNIGQLDAFERGKKIRLQLL